MKKQQRLDYTLVQNNPKSCISVFRLTCQGLRKLQVTLKRLEGLSILAGLLDEMKIQR